MFMIDQALFIAAADRGSRPAAAKTPRDAERSPASLPSSDSSADEATARISLCGAWDDEQWRL